MNSSSLWVGEKIELRPDSRPPRAHHPSDYDPAMDEVCAKDASIHFERMGADAVWCCIDAGDKTVHIWLRAVRGTIIFSAAEDS